MNKLEETSSEVRAEKEMLLKLVAGTMHFGKSNDPCSV
jgi:hypothetical protein